MSRRAGPGFQPAGRAPAPPPLDLVQDFVNTEVPVWAQDDIATPGELGAWLRARGLLADDTSVDAESFARTRALRSLLRELAALNTHAEGVGEDVRDAFVDATSGARLRIVLDARGDPRLEPDGEGVDAALAQILTLVLEAHGSGTWRRMKSCPGAHCGWLFYDGSRNASSTWCSMSICGNRAKIAAYRQRRNVS